VPVGFGVNPNVAVVLPMMLDEDEATAIERGIDGAHFFGYSLAHYYGMGRHRPGRTNVWEEFLENRDERGFARDIVTPDASPLAVRIMQHGLGSLRGAIGTPEQVTDLCRRYEAAGVDQVIFVLQAGPNRHEHICDSIRLFGEQVAPAFAATRDESERAKAERLAPQIEAALARGPQPREAPEYVIDEEAELARVAGIRHHEGVGDRVLGAVLGRLVRGASDAQLERRFGSDLAQRALLSGLTRQFEPRMAFGFEGDIAYELQHVGNGRPPSRWTIRVEGDEATLIPGAVSTAAITFRLSVPDFARLAAEEVDPQELLFSGRFDMEGDLGLATRVPEMFGAPPTF
jgi:hypothetical protein